MYFTLSVKTFEYHERGLAPDGSALKKEIPPQYRVEFINQRTGEVTYTPAGIDPGFAYNAGQARQRALARLQANKLEAAVPALAQAAKLQRLHVGLPRQDFTGQRPGLAELPPFFAIEQETEVFLTEWLERKNAQAWQNGVSSINVPHEASSANPQSNSRFSFLSYFQ